MAQVSRQDSYLMNGDSLITQIFNLFFLSCVVPCAVSPQERFLQECEDFDHFCPGLNEVGECGVMPNNNWSCTREFSSTSLC